MMGTVAIPVTQCSYCAEFRPSSAIKHWALDEREPVATVYFCSLGCEERWQEVRKKATDTA